MLTRKRKYYSVLVKRKRAKLRLKDNRLPWLEEK